MSVKILKKQSVYVAIGLLLTSFLLTACGPLRHVSSAFNKKEKNGESLAVTGLTDLYQYQILDSQTQKRLTVAELANDLSKTQLIFFGEYHSHQASHKFQLDLLQALYQKNPQIILSMEQFTRDAQPIVDGYLADRYGEETLIEDGDAWPIYQGAYRPLMEFAKEHDIPVIAANAPAMFVRCVGKKGFEVLQQLTDDKKNWSAQKVDFNNQKYRDKFMSFLKESGDKHGQSNEQMSKRMKNIYAAQLLRDTTMAESIVNVLVQYPEHQVVHLNGAFHSDGRLGTVAVLEQINAKISTKVISPLMVENPQDPKASDEELKQGDYLYFVRALPERYLDKDKENAATYKLIKKRMAKKCDLEN
ncbi:MAG: ChaN family lipoprotein [Enterobacterales bacterium]|nr:ChaN family lipoprotein [Enterobacterales bacterium]